MILCGRRSDFLQARCIFNGMGCVQIDDSRMRAAHHEGSRSLPTIETVSKFSHLESERGITRY